MSERIEMLWQLLFYLSNAFKKNWGRYWNYRAQLKIHIFPGYNFLIWIAQHKQRENQCILNIFFNIGLFSINVYFINIFQTFILIFRFYFRYLITEGRGISHEETRLFVLYWLQNTALIILLSVNMNTCSEPVHSFSIIIQRCLVSLTNNQSLPSEVHLNSSAGVRQCATSHRDVCFRDFRETKAAHNGIDYALVVHLTLLHWDWLRFTVSFFISNHNL